ADDVGVAADGLHPFGQRRQVGVELFGVQLPIFLPGLAPHHGAAVRLVDPGAVLLAVLELSLHAAAAVLQLAAVGPHGSAVARQAVLDARTVLAVLGAAVVGGAGARALAAGQQGEGAGEAVGYLQGPAPAGGWHVA